MSVRISAMAMSQRRAREQNVDVDDVLGGRGHRVGEPETQWYSRQPAQRRDHQALGSEDQSHVTGVAADAAEDADLTVELARVTFRGARPFVARGSGHLPTRSALGWFVGGSHQRPDGLLVDVPASRDLLVYSWCARCGNWSMIERVRARPGRTAERTAGLRAR